MKIFLSYEQLFSVMEGLSSASSATTTSWSEQEFTQCGGLGKHDMLCLCLDYLKREERGADEGMTAYSCYN